MGNTTKNNMSKTAKGWIIAICVAIVAIFIGMYLFVQKGEQWTAFYFPHGCSDKSPACLSQRIVSPTFSGKDACMKWGADTLYGHNGAPAADPLDYFSCEENCQFYLGEDKCAIVIHGYRDVLPADRDYPEAPL